MSIDDLREEISALDRRLVELLAERQRIAGAIGRDKVVTGQATRDYEREKVVIETAREQAAALSLDPKLAESIFRRLIHASLASQERDRVAAEGQGNGRTALVIGGAGKMGGWFVDFFTSQGYGTTIADNRAQPAPSSFRDWKDAGIDFDVIVVATPLAISGTILQELATLRPRGLIFDIGSLKSPVRDGLTALASAGCCVASLHPMYGPDTELLSGKHLIFVDVGVPDATARAKDLFAATMVQQLDMGLDDHDRLIAYVLGLSHALNIAFFTALAESGEAAPRLAQLSSTTFDAQLLVASAVAGDNPHLYFEIQSLNRFGLGPLDALCDAAERIRKLVADHDEEAFVRMMEQGRAYLATRR